MAYREAKTDEEKKRGKSTDELSFEEALAFFKKRGKEKGATKFRWRGDAYSVSGEKLSSKPPKKSASSSAPKSTSTRPQARRTDIKALSNPPAVEERNLSSTRGGRGDGVAEMARRVLDRPNTAERDTGTDNNRIIRKNFSDVKGGRGDGFKEVISRKVEQSFVYDGKQYDRTGFLAKFKAATDEDKRKMWEKLTPGQRRNLNLPIKNLSFSPRGPRTSNMAKGGMVKSGNKDYKKSGMFYKSGSPRGYK